MKTRIDQTRGSEVMLEATSAWFGKHLNRTWATSRNWITPPDRSTTCQITTTSGAGTRDRTVHRWWL